MLKKLKLPLLLIFTILLTLGLSLSLNYLLAAWSNPTGVPTTCPSGSPGCDAPINTAANLQVKDGTLWIGGDNYTLNPGQFGLLVEKGNVGIGTASPASELQIVSTNTTDLWTTINDGIYSYAPFPQEVSIYNNGADTNNSYAGIFFRAGTTGGAKVSTARIGAIREGDYKANLVFGTRNSSGTFGERMRIDGNGNVGIGTTGPANTLHVASAGTREGLSTSALFTDTTDTTEGMFIGFNSTSDYGLIAASDLGVAWKNLVLQPSGGKVGIGTTAPGDKLDVIGGGIRAGNGTYIAGMSYATYPIMGSFSNHALGIYTNSTEKVTILTNGNVGIGTTAPNYQLHVISTLGIGAAGLYQQQLNLTNNAIQSLNLGVGYTNMSLQALGGNVGIGTTEPANTLHVASAGIREGLSTSALFTDTTDTTEGVFIGFNSTSDYGLIAASDLGVGWKNLVLQPSGGKVGIGTTNPSGAKLQINPPASTEGLRIVTASDYSPLNIRNSATDIFRVDQSGILAVGQIPWARLSGSPSSCSVDQFLKWNGSTWVCSYPTYAP